jgi:urease subunit beta
MFGTNYLYGDTPIEINAGRATVKLTVTNTGDRPVQVGSHYHFFEANSALEFDRSRALGMRLNIIAGTAVRFEPGDSREVELCAVGGTGRLVGFSGLLNGSVVSHPELVEAVQRAFERGFAGAHEPERFARPARGQRRAAAKRTPTRTTRARRGTPTKRAGAGRPAAAEPKTASRTGRRRATSQKGAR